MEKKGKEKYKRIRLAVAAVILMGMIAGCAYNSDYVPTESPHLYWKDIEVEVTNIDKKHWFATTHWYVVNVSVHSEEYGLDKTLEIKDSGAFGCPKEYDYEVGDIVPAELYTWKMDSTGEIVRREINRLK